MSGLEEECEHHVPVDESPGPACAAVTLSKPFCFARPLFSFEQFLGSARRRSASVSRVAVNFAEAWVSSLALTPASWDKERETGRSTKTEFKSTGT